MNKDLQDRLQKYEDLVVYARINPERELAPMIKETAMRVLKDHSIEAQALLDSSDGWQHGFNSGCLAILRYIETYESTGASAAINEFPNLDT